MQRENMQKKQQNCIESGKPLKLLHIAPKDSLLIFLAVPMQPAPDP